MIELVYGSESADVDSLAASVGRVLDIPFECRDSVYKGTYYLAKSVDGRFEVISNALADNDDQPEENKEYSWQIDTNRECLTLLWFDIEGDAAQRVKERIRNSNVSVKVLRETEY
jgi:hypothetical protein